MFFLFKHKTAYEVRISDWSSYLCSSNLRRKISDIGHDLGIQSSSTGQIDPDDAMLLSTFLTRTMTIAARAYGWDVSEMGPMRVTEPYLERDIAKMQSAPPKPDSRIESTIRSEEHTSELQSLMRISYAVFCLQKQNKKKHT